MTTTQTPAKATYRKTQQGEWVVCGPTSLIRSGTDIQVTKKDGSAKTEHIARTGRPFVAGGVEMVYGYIASSPPARRNDSAYYDDQCDHVLGFPCGDCGRR